MKQLRPDLYAIRGALGWTHLLVASDGLALMDSGFVLERYRLQRAIITLGGKAESLKAIPHHARSH